CAGGRLREKRRRDFGQTEDREGGQTRGEKEQRYSAQVRFRRYGGATGDVAGELADRALGRIRETLLQEARRFRRWRASQAHGLSAGGRRVQRAEVHAVRQNEGTAPGAGSLSR